MNELSAFIIKLNPPATAEIEYNIERDMHIAFRNFTEEEQNKFVMDEVNRTMIAFINIQDKYKLDEIISAATRHQSNVVAMYEDVTEKFLYKNDFSCYDIKSELIDKFIESRLKTDDVLDKINVLGMTNLTEVDKRILQSK